MGFFSKTTGAPPPPPPPPPPSQASIQRRPAPAQRRQAVAQPPPGTLAIGVETEFLIAARQPDPSIRSAEEFSRAVAAGYKQLLQSRPSELHPSMHNAINESFRGERFSEWSLDHDSTIAVPNPGREPWGLEVISPILRVHAGSAWRSHIEILWSHLERHYKVSPSSSCGTHVHMSIAGGYSLEDLKRIASAVIHFEPAFEAVMPKDRLGNEYTKSNWIDNKNFGYKNYSREACIAMINACKTPRELVLLMNPDNEGERDKMFGWNFLNLLQSTQSTIEFRRGAASTNAQQVFVWIEVAMSFLKASMILGTTENLQRVPATVGGLRWFVAAAKLPTDIFDKRYVDLFYSRAKDGAAAQPTPVGKLSKEKANKLKRKKMEDKNRSIMLEKTLNAPYWD